MSDNWFLTIVLIGLIAVILASPITRHGAVYLDAQGCEAYENIGGNPKAEKLAAGCLVVGSVAHKFNTVTINGVEISKFHVTATTEMIAIADTDKLSAWEWLATFYGALAVLVGSAVLWVVILYRKSKHQKESA